MSGTGRFAVLLAVTGQPFEEALLAALARPGSRLRVARRCLDLVDLLAAASSGTAPVAVVWAGLHRLDREAISRLAAVGVVTVAVVATGDRPGAVRARELGALTVVEAGAELPAELTAAVLAAHGAGALGPSEPPTGYAAPPRLLPAPGPGSRSGGAVTPGGPHSAGAAASAPLPAHGRLVAVWGPVGAPGRTSVAITVADEMARAGVGTLLADADTYGPSVAQRLAILDEASGLAAATRAANDGSLDVAAVTAAARSVSGGLAVLTGLTRADRWPELPGPALAAVWRTCKQAAQVVVVDCGFCLEEDDELAFDMVTLRRNGAALATMAAADLLLVVGAADPVGVARVLRGLHELTDLAERRPGGLPAERRVVMTQVRAGPTGRAPGRRVQEFLARAAGAADPVLVPDDRPAHDQWLATGRTLADVAPRSPARAVLARLAGELAGDLAGRGPAPGPSEGAGEVPPAPARADAGAGAHGASPSHAAARGGRWRRRPPT